MEDSAIADALYAEIDKVLGLIQRHHTKYNAATPRPHSEIIAQLSEEIDHHYYEEEFSGQVSQMATFLEVLDILQIPSQCHRSDIDALVGQYCDLCP